MTMSSPPVLGESAASSKKSGERDARSAVWKVLAIILFGVLVLITTDSHEIKNSSVRVGGSDSTHPREFGVNVVEKHPPNNQTKKESGPTGLTEKNKSDTSPSSSEKVAKSHEQNTETATADNVKRTAPLESSSAPIVTDDKSPKITPTEDINGTTTNTIAPAASASKSAQIPRTKGTQEETTTNNNPLNRITYRRRGQPMNATDRDAMISKWGSWTLVDTKERPQHDYFKEYPNRDIPRDKFPSNAWQVDKEYLAKFLPEGLALVQRAQEAILAEYGKTGDSPFEERAKMFEIELISDLANATGLEAGMRRGRKTGRPSTEQGGWMTPKSWEGLKRRMLHAVMTQDSFVFAMSGHSAAAGHGNHFQQSYTLQVQWILEAVFARLGVRHQARNFGNGGMGTIHNGMGAASVFGPDVDVLMWDSGMTESEPAGPEVSARQQILGGVKVPVIWTLRAGTAKLLHLTADADTGYVGNGNFGIKMGVTLDEIEAMPWAMQYLSCGNEMSEICRRNEYNGRCWIDRDDFTPPAEQKKMGGRQRWHPGNRVHQLQGRVLAFGFLQALKEALTDWNEAKDYELPDDAWHLTDRYEKIRNNVRALGNDVGRCHIVFSKHGMQHLCNESMKSRTVFTPRAYPELSSIRALLRPEMAAVVGEGKPNIYSPPDVFNPDLHPPPGAIDVLNIVEAGVDFRSVLSPDYHTDFYKKPTFSGAPKVTLGKGATLATQVGDNFCDGSVDSFCKRGEDNNCMLYAHNDGRNGINIDVLSGWFVMNLPGVKNGHISIKLDSWHWPEENMKTDGWQSINNERRLDDSSLERESGIHSNTTMDWKQTRRELGRKKKPNEYCDDFKFEYAIDGKVTALAKDEIQTKLLVVQRVVEVITILNQTDYTGGEEKEVEVAVRILGCPRKSSRVYFISHVYWS